MTGMSHLSNCLVYSCYWVERERGRERGRERREREIKKQLTLIHVYNIHVHVLYMTNYYSPPPPPNDHAQYHNTLLHIHNYCINITSLLCGWL